MIENRVELELLSEFEKDEAVDLVDKWRFHLGFEVSELNRDKPWGAYWKIDKEQTESFLDLFFPEMKEVYKKHGLDYSPKLLLVAPNKKLSWQYHERRAEEWKVIFGTVGVKQNDFDDEPTEEKRYKAGDRVSLKNRERHRLAGKNGWGLVAEVWIHTDKERLSDEEDIVRVKDEFDRK